MLTYDGNVLNRSDSTMLQRLGTFSIGMPFQGRIRLALWPTVLALWL